jgi:NADH-quinone oxidoreductase subunit N
MSIPLNFYFAASPSLVLLIGSMITLLLGVSSVGKNLKAMFILNLGVIALSLLCVFLVNFSDASNLRSEFLSGSYVFDDFSFFAQTAILISTLVICLFIRSNYVSTAFLRGDILAIFQMVLAGMLVLVSTDELITFFVALEIASIGLYCLAGYTRVTKLSQEGAIKYFILGAIAAAVLLFGIGLLYVSTGTMRISEIGPALLKAKVSPWIEMGIVFTVVGLCFKMALVPFHMWAPDAYEGAPTGITAFMATCVKVMIVVGSLRIFAGGLSHAYSIWAPIMMTLAALSLLVGNIMAISQQSVKRMLAYSSVSHSGYMALAIAALSGTNQTWTVPAILFYLISYLLVSLASFGILMWLENERCDNILIDDLSGLAKKYPYAATGLAICMFSLGGMPPTVGFLAKLFIFNATLSNGLIGVTIVAVIASAIALFYYLRLIVKMFMQEQSPSLSTLINPKPSKLVFGLTFVSIALLIVLGTFGTSPVWEMAIRSSKQAAGG